MHNFYHIAINEIRKELLLVWSYRLQWICEIFTLILFFFFLSRINYSSFPKSNQFDFFLISYAIWFYSIIIIGDIGGKLASEMRTGTFEQLCLAIVPMTWIVLSRILASIIRATVLFFLLTIPLTMLFSIHITFQDIFLFFAVFICLIPGLLGLSFLLGGITLLVKETGPIINIVNNSLLFLSGGFVPLEVFPQWIVPFTKYLPTTLAIKIFKSQMQGSTVSLFHFGEIANLVAISILYLSVGFLTFLYCEKKAKSSGTLGHY